MMKLQDSLGQCTLSKMSVSESNSFSESQSGKHTENLKFCISVYGGTCRIQ